ncbi:MAG: TonB-dependent receptor [Flammeovirgaceae bacterium]
MVKILRIILSISLLVLIAVETDAQGVTTATISGRVIDEKGETLPGATILAIHTPTNTEYGTSTRLDGRYTLPNLRIGGPYAIKVSFVGYKDQELNNIFLKLGQNMTLNFNMSDQLNELEEVVITAEGGSNQSKSGLSTNVDNATLKKLPTITRSAADIYRINPASDGNSFGGRNDQYNNFSLDGSIFNNPFGLDAATPGGQTDAQPISLDAIDQIQVSLTPFDVRQAGFTGASVNAVTKSGTNQFSGTAFAFYRTQDLTGSKVDGSDIFVPDLTQLQTGASIGGPIIKDKLFFFANFELERREDLGSNFIANRTNATGENVSRVEAEDLETVSDLLLSRFGYVTGPYEGFTHNTDNQKGIIKFDWNINKKHTLTAKYNFLDASKQLPAHPSALGRRGPDQTTLQFFNSGYQINNKIHSGFLELKSLFNNKFSNKFQIGYTVFNDSRDPLSAPFPVLNINRDGVRYIVAGHEPFSINNQLDQNVFQFTNNFDVYLAEHTLTFGTSFERFDFDNSFNLGVYEPFGVPYDGGTFGPGFASVQDFVDFVNAGSMDAVVAHAQSTFAAQNWALAETTVGQFALYAQDEWQVTPNFLVTYGVRMDMPLYFDTKEKIEQNLERKAANYDPSTVYFDEFGNEVLFDHTVLPRQKPLFSPRVGFSLNVKENGAVRLRGGAGLFTGRFPFVWIGNQVANPDWFFYTTTHPDFQFPQVMRSNGGVDFNLKKGWSASADITYTKDVNSMMVRNYGVRPPTGKLNGVDNRPIYTFEDRAIYQPFGAPVDAYVFTNSDKGYSINVTYEVKRNWKNGWFTSLAYNYLDAREVSSIEAEISGDAFQRNPALGNVNQDVLSHSLYGNKHRFVGLANKTFKYAGDKLATTISVFFEYAQGGRFSYTYSGDINGDFSPLNDLLYIPTDAEIDQMTFDETQATTAAQRTALKAYIAQDDYLSENRGEYAERYAILSPWYSRWDIRLLQDFQIASGNKLQLSLDLLNAGNFISSSWGVRQFPTNTQPIGVSVDNNGDPTYSFDTNLTNSFTNDFSLLSRWQLQIGLRYIFN